MLNTIQYTGELIPVELGNRTLEGVIDLWLRRNPATEQNTDGDDIQTAEEAYMEMPVEDAPEQTDIEQNFNQWFDKAAAWSKPAEKPDPLRELAAKIDALLTYQGLTVREIGNGAYEVIKQQPASGDYLDPIPYKAGDTVTAGLWYYTTDKTLPHEAIASGTPSGFRDPEYFSYVD